jgi:hypothetical protein
MTDQHTPGPWRIQATIYSRQPQIVNEHGAFVADTDKHNARLIASAPEMWDLIVELFEDPKLSLIIGGNPNRVGALMERADKLRAKVRGTQ